MDNRTTTIKQYRLANGEFVHLPSTYSSIQVQRILEEMNTRMARIPVIQCGEQVGWLPRDFNPDARFIKSKSYFYDPRPGDFTRVGETWVVNRTLGGGDLNAVPGFVRYHGER